MNQRLNARPPLKRRRHSTFLHVIRDLMHDPLSAVCLLFGTADSGGDLCGPDRAL